MKMTYGICNSSVIFLKDFPIRCALDECRCLLGVSSNSDVNSPNTSLEIGHKVEEWDFKE